MMPHCPAAGLGPRIMPAGFDAPLGFESQRLEFLTGLTTDSTLIINPQSKFAITKRADSGVDEAEPDRRLPIDSQALSIIISCRIHKKRLRAWETMGVRGVKNLRRWSILLAFVLGIFGCSQKATSGFKPNSEPDGFAGIKWSTPFSEIKSDMVESKSISDPAEPDVKIKIYYTRKEDSLKLGEAQLDRIEYAFWRGKFAEARITTIGPENFDALRKFLFEKYGAVNKFQGAYSWDGTVTQIALRYSEPTKTALLLVASTNLASQEVKEIFDKDKD